MLDYNYPQMRDSGYAWPVIDLRLRYAGPARFGQRIAVTARLREWENRLKLDYVIRDVESGKRLTRGHSVQVAVGLADGEMLLASPPALSERLAAWQASQSQTSQSQTSPSQVAPSQTADEDAPATRPDTRNAVMTSRLAIAATTLLLTASAFGASAAEFDARALTQQLARTAPVCGDFQQTRWLEDVGAQLKSRGQFHLIGDPNAPEGLVWDTTSPSRTVSRCARMPAKARMASRCPPTSRRWRSCWSTSSTATGRRSRSTSP
ncbi:hypothetical protein ACU8V3_09610 [Cobetia marina]